MSDKSVAYHADKPIDAGSEFLRTIANLAVLAFVFVVLARLGSVLNLAAESLSPTALAVAVQILGRGLQIFAALWFIALAVNAWRRFTKTDNVALKANSAEHVA
jgi:hypothetical protein